MDGLKIAGIALVLLLVGTAIANLPMWIPFVLVGIALLILIFRH